MARRGLAVAMVVMAVGIVVFLSRGGGAEHPSLPASLGPIPADAHYVDPQGSDSGAGTAGDPWRTLEKAVSSAHAGDTVVLDPGTYGAVDHTTYMSKAGSSSAPIIYRGNPAKALPRITGHVRISGSYQRFDHLLFDGPTGKVKATSADNPGGEQVEVSIMGSGSTVQGVEISSSEVRDSHWHAGIFVDAGSGIKLTGNYIHDNGDRSDPGQENQSHGIYWSAGSGLIANNVVAKNVARGVQLYPNASKVTVANNTIAENGKAGIQFANETHDCIAVNNVVTYNEVYGIRSDSLSGSGNVVRSNLVWQNGSHDLEPAGGLTLTDNKVANPGFSAGSDYRPPTSSPVVDRGMSSYAPAQDFDSKSRPQGAGPDLGAFEVH